MSDPNRPRENHLKGKFKGLLDYLMGADRPNDERPGGSRLTGTPQLTGEGTPPVCLQCANSLALIFCISGIPECNARSSRLRYEGFKILCGSKCVSCDNSFDGLKY